MNIEHRAAVTDETRRNLKWLAASVGRKAWAAELAIRYAIRSGMRPDPRFVGTARIHVHLKEDYRSRFGETELGSLLDASLRQYRMACTNGVRALQGRDMYEFDFPEPLLDDLMLESFSGRHEIEGGLVGVLEDTMRRLLAEMPDPAVVSKSDVRIRPVELRVDPRLYAEFRHRARALGWSPHTLLIYRVQQAHRRPAPPVAALPPATVDTVATLAAKDAVRRTA